MRRVLFALIAMTPLLVTAGCRMVAGQCDCYDPGASCLCGSCGYEQVLKTSGHDPILPHAHHEPVHTMGPVVNPTPVYGGTVEPVQQLPAQPLPSGPTGHAEPPTKF